MTKYFKGNIIDVNCFPDYNYSLCIIRINPDYHETYHVLSNTSHKAFIYFKKYSSHDLKNLIKLIKNIVTSNAVDEKKEALDNTMISIFNPTIIGVLGNEIIYEKIYDENGNVYGKELITGSIFPISLKYSSFDVNYSIKDTERMCYDIENDKGYYINKTWEIEYLLDFDDNRHVISQQDYILLKSMSEVTPKYIALDGQTPKMTICDKPFITNICLKPKMTFSSGQRVEYAITNETIANELEVKNYLGMFGKGLWKKKNQKYYENKINNFALSNYLGDIHYVTGNSIIKERVSESAITHEMQELEYSLLKLKTVAKDDYDLLNKEYLELLNQDESGLHVSTLSLNSVISLQNRAELAFVCHGGDSKQILAYLENHINNYLENFNQGLVEKTEITLQDLDKLSGNFLHSKNSYTIKEQNVILRCLSFLYFLEMYENKDILTSDDLKNSYIADNIKRILVIINVLGDEGIIKEIPNSLYDISDLDSFLEFIKKIELNNDLKKDGKVLIKKIQQ